MVPARLVFWLSHPHTKTFLTAIGHVYTDECLHELTIFYWHPLLLSRSVESMSTCTFLAEGFESFRVTREKKKVLKIEESGRA